MYCPFTKLVPGDELMHEASERLLGRPTDCETSAPCCFWAALDRNVFARVCPAQCGPSCHPGPQLHLKSAPELPSCLPVTCPPLPPPLQVQVELEGDARPRRLSVLIRKVDVISISSLQAFMVGGWAACGRRAAACGS